MTERDLDQRMEQWTGRSEGRTERGLTSWTGRLTSAWEEGPFSAGFAGASPCRRRRPALGRLSPAEKTNSGAGLLVRFGRNRSGSGELLSPQLFRRKP